MRLWLRDFNENVLNKRDMHVKGFTFGRRREGGAPSNNDSDQLSVLVFALSRKESARIRKEPVLQHPMKSIDEVDKNYSCWGCPSHSDRAL